MPNSIVSLNPRSLITSNYSLNFVNGIFAVEIMAIFLINNKKSNIKFPFSNGNGIEIIKVPSKLRDSNFSILNFTIYHQWTMPLNYELLELRKLQMLQNITRVENLQADIQSRRLQIQQEVRSKFTRNMNTVECKISIL